MSTPLNAEKPPIESAPEPKPFSLVKDFTYTGPHNNPNTGRINVDQIGLSNISIKLRQQNGFTGLWMVPEEVERVVKQLLEDELKGTRIADLHCEVKHGYFTGKVAINIDWQELEDRRRSSLSFYERVLETIFPSGRLKPLQLINPLAGYAPVTVFCS